jgi:flagellar biosynthesis regulator FlbT
MDRGQSDSCRFELREGEQLVVNGALVTAVCNCSFMVSGGASLLVSGSAAKAGRPLPAHQLYYAVLELAGLGIPVADERHRLLELLAVIVESQRTRAAQQDCSNVAAALISEDIDGLLAAARALASTEASGRQAIPRENAA